MLKRVISFSWAQVYEGAIDRGEEAKKKALPVTGNAFGDSGMERGLAIGPGPFPVLEQT